jgi:hypothetical protein
MTKVVPIDSKQKDATVYTMMDSEVEASLHSMYVNGKLSDEQMTLVAEGLPNRGSGSSHYQGTSTSKPKKKKAKKKGLMVKGNFLGGRKYRPSKKTTKKGRRASRLWLGH